AATDASQSGAAGVSAGPNGANTTLDSGSTINATLTKSVDAKKAKAGDEITAKAQNDVRSGGNVVIPKGAKLIGHVTQAKAREKGESESALGIAFDRAVLKNGQEVALNT